MLKANQRVVQSVGNFYLYYLQTLFHDMIKVYKVYSEQITQSVLQPGLYPDYIVKPMKSVRRDILRLI